MSIWVKCQLFFGSTRGHPDKLIMSFKVSLMYIEIERKKKVEKHPADVTRKKKWHFIFHFLRTHLIIFFHSHAVQFPDLSWTARKRWLEEENIRDILVTFSPSSSSSSSSSCLSPDEMTDNFYFPLFFSFFPSSSYLQRRHQVTDC